MDAKLLGFHTKCCNVLNTENVEMELFLTYDSTRKEWQIPLGFRLNPRLNFFRNKKATVGKMFRSNKSMTIMLVFVKGDNLSKRMAK